MSGAMLPDLPVTQVLPDLLGAMETRPNVVLVAPPGAGKTTLVPLALEQAGWARKGRIVLLEPRRLAARAAAHRMASLLGEEPGGTVGYAMRMESRVSAKTRILVATEGVLSRMILDDPELSGVAAILFDEFHERSLDGDFGLALALDVQGGLRPDLRLLVMSATLDGARVSRILGDAPVVESAGRSFPVEIRYRPRPPEMAVEQAVAAVVREAIADEPGSVLAFLPGQREIERAADILGRRLPPDIDVIPLYGALEMRDQDAAIKPAPPGRRKIVLATSIAETSITIDGVRIVVDSGLARLPRYEPSTGLTRLETVRVSRASAEQRAGRAGRTQPGIAVRLWREEQTAALPAFTPPEIAEADLSRLVLDCAAFGVTDPATLAFLDPPPAPALAEARLLLQELDAIDEAGRLTPRGEAMRSLSLPVRLAHMVAEAAAAGEAMRAAELAILITERGLGGNDVDLDQRLSRFRADRGRRAQAAGQMAKRLAQGVISPSSGASRHLLPGGEKRERDSSAGDLISPRGEGGSRSEPSEGDIPHKNGALSAGGLLFLAYPDRIAKARGEHGRFLLANGRGASLDAADRLAGEPWLVIADLAGKAQNARILSAAPIAEAELRSLAGDRLEARRETTFDAERQNLRAREVVRLGAIVLSERNLPPPAGDEADCAMIAAIREHGLGLLPWGKAGTRNRLAWLHKGLGAPWPDMSDEALLARLDQWLLPYLGGRSSLSTLDDRILAEALVSLVPYELQRRLGELAPTHFDAPSGSRVPIRYDGEEPVLAIRVQELFGLDRHPSIADGRVPLTLELLSPAHRPIQTTRDLPGFWRGSWGDVRAEMRGRYPKHVWPEDPREAEATSRAKPRVK